MLLIVVIWWTCILKLYSIKIHLDNVSIYSLNSKHNRAKASIDLKKISKWRSSADWGHKSVFIDGIIISTKWYNYNIIKRILVLAYRLLQDGNKKFWFRQPKIFAIKIEERNLLRKSLDCCLVSTKIYDYFRWLLISCQISNRYWHIAICFCILSNASHTTCEVHRTKQDTAYTLRLFIARELKSLKCSTLSRKKAFLRGKQHKRFDLC